jgi:hypothetical protein
MESIKRQQQALM